jgi:hypothetical protein
MTSIVALDPASRGGIIGLAPGRSGARVESWLALQSSDSRAAVQVVAIDPSAPYAVGIRRALPHARIVLDHFPPRHARQSGPDRRAPAGRPRAARPAGSQDRSGLGAPPAAVHRAAGLLPGQPGHRRCRCRAGQQRQPDPGQARQAGLRDPADERQPTAQNTCEAGADGDLAAFRNWSSDSQVTDLARVWNVDPMQIPHYSPPTHIMQQLRYIEDGSIRFLWVQATNPAVSLPALRRVRSLLSQDRLFLVVQDIFLSETAQMADVVLPAATWGEKEGTFTNVDRTVHWSGKAVELRGRPSPTSTSSPNTRAGWASRTKTARRW